MKISAKFLLFITSIACFITYQEARCVAQKVEVSGADKRDQILTYINVSNKNIVKFVQNVTNVSATTDIENYIFANT